MEVLHRVLMVPRRILRWVLGVPHRVTPNHAREWEQKGEYGLVPGMWMMLRKPAYLPPPPPLQ